MSKIRKSGGLFPDDLDQDSLRSSAIEFAVENLFPRTKVQFSVRHGDDHFPPHDLPLHVRIGVVLTGSVVAVPLW